jgi:very-short-patch-repair endonuclease
MRRQILPLDGGGFGPAPAKAGVGVTVPQRRRLLKKHLTPGSHERARALRRNMTDAERRVWQILRSAQIAGHKFRRQVPLGRYITPSLTLPRLRGREGRGCHEARLIIEIDGGQHDRLSAQERAQSFSAGSGVPGSAALEQQSALQPRGRICRHHPRLAASSPPLPPIEGEGGNRRRAVRDINGKALG